MEEKEKIKNLTKEINELSDKNDYLEKRCKELWEENESLKFKLFIRGIKK